VFPIDHGSSKVRCFHCGSGMIPDASFGMSMPVGAPNPSMRPYFAIASGPTPRTLGANGVPAASV